MVRELTDAFEMERWSDCHKIGQVLLDSPMERSFAKVRAAGLGNIALRLSMINEPKRLSVVGRKLVVQVDRAARHGF